jgi:hypothetical protein
MKVSALSPVPPNTYWRSLFAANAPGSVCDRGDYFYLQAATNGAGQPAYTFGTAVRDSNGDYTYTSLGSALSGEMDTADNLVKVRLAFTALDPYLTHGPPVRGGSTLVGLRGATGAASGSSVGHDETRGGGSYSVCSEATAVPETRMSAGFVLSPPMPNPARNAVGFTLTLPRPGWVDLGVFDSQGRRVRNIFGGALGAGDTRFQWDGRTDGGRSAAPGAYFVRMMVGGRALSQRLVLVH